MNVFINGTLLPWNAEYLSWLWSLDLFDHESSELQDWFLDFRYLTERDKHHDARRIEMFAKVALDRCLEYREDLIKKLEDNDEVEDPVEFVELWIEILARIREIAGDSETVVFSSDQKPPSREQAMKLLAALDKAHQKLKDEP